jgi:hypothetical protein
VPRGQLAAEPRGAAHLVVAADPAVRQQRATAIEHLQRQLVPRAGADLLGDPALLPTLAILRPFGGQIEPEMGATRLGATFS